MTSTKIAIVGVGKIARDQHLPSISANPDFELAATVSRNSGVDGIANFDTIDAMLEACPDVSAVSLCQPPQARFEAAVAAMRAGRHVLLEKPPGASVAEVQALVAFAERSGVSLFAAWHSRFASGIQPARVWLADKRVLGATVTWREDVRLWHPGQAWIWQPGGLGVFDPGINALSIVTEILPEPIHLTEAILEFPENRDAPIAAQLSFDGTDGMTVKADFDWRQEGPQTWDVVIETSGGKLALTQGGDVMEIDGKRIPTKDDGEYAGIYRRFAELIRGGACDVDIAPLVHVADAFMLGRRRVVEPFLD